MQIKVLESELVPDPLCWIVTHEKLPVAVLVVLTVFRIVRPLQRSDYKNKLLSCLLREYVFFEMISRRKELIILIDIVVASSMAAFVVSRCVVTTSAEFVHILNGYEK